VVIWEIVGETFLTARPAQAGSKIRGTTIAATTLG
jgi:hypothetical protein